MLVIELCLWVNFLGTIQGALILSVKSNSTYDTCILDEETAVINCTITPSTTSSVVWKKIGTTQAVCLHTEDTCVPASSGRNIFTSDYQMYQFFFTISDVTLGTDEGTYTCEEGMIEESINISVCKVPTNVTISEIGTGTVTVTGTSGCVFPDSDVTVEWFYVPVLDPSKEKKLNISATRTSSVSGCVAGARTVTSSFQHANSSINTHEVKFRVKFYHPALASPVEANSINTYFLDQGEDTTEKPIDNRAKIGGGIGGSFVGVLILLCVGYYLKRRISDVQIVFLDNTYILTWSAMDEAERYFIMRRKTKKVWKVFAIVNSSQTSYRVYTRLYKWKILVETKDRKMIDIGEAQEKSKNIADDEKIEIKRALENETFILKWTVPKDVSTMVKKYHIWRKEGEEEWENIAVVSNKQTHYTVDFKWTVTAEALAAGSIVDLTPVSNTLVLRWTTQTGRQNNEGRANQAAIVDPQNVNCHTLYIEWKVVAELQTIEITLPLERESDDSDIWEIKLVRNKPSAPRSLGLMYTRGKCEKLTWNPPDFPSWSEIDTYYIWKKDEDSKLNDWTLYHTVDRTVQSTKETQFPKKCNFMISAANKYGIGDILDTITEEKDYGTPDMPTNIVFKSQDNSVTWDPPNYCGASLLKKYQIVIIEYDSSFHGLIGDSRIAEHIKSKMDDSNYIQAFVPWNKTIYTVPEHLSTTEGFVCSICAHNDEGCGKSSFLISD